MKNLHGVDRLSEAFDRRRASHALGLPPLFPESHGAMPSSDGSAMYSAVQPLRPARAADGLGSADRRFLMTRLAVTDIDAAGINTKVHR